jgi:Ca2+-binding EF-hand superfamily protein
VDVDGDQRLDRNEVLTVLKAQYRLDWRKLEEHLDSLWERWDQDGSGDLAYEELFAPEGLIAYITGEEVANQFAPEETPSRGEPPALSDAAGWFRYWDEDGNGTLDMQEVQRALMKTFKLGKEMHRVHTMRETLDAVWPVFDLDGSGEIDFDEFTSRSGLGESLAISVRQMEKDNLKLARGPCPPLRRLASETYVGRHVWAV